MVPPPEKSIEFHGGDIAAGPSSPSSEKRHINRLPMTSMSPVCAISTGDCRDGAFVVGCSLSAAGMSYGDTDVCLLLPRTEHTGALLLVLGAPRKFGRDRLPDSLFCDYV